MASVPISVNSSGDNTIVSADTLRKINVLSFVIVAAGTVSVKFKDGASTDLTGAMPMVANMVISSPTPLAEGGGVVIQGQFETSINKDLIINLSAGVFLYGYLTYRLKN